MAERLSDKFVVWDGKSVAGFTEGRRYKVLGTTTNTAGVSSHLIKNDLGKEVTREDNWFRPSRRPAPFGRSKRKEPKSKV